MEDFLKWTKNWDIWPPPKLLLENTVDSYSPEKVFRCELEPFGNLLSPIHGDPYSKCIFTIQGVPKMKNAKKWAKVDINEFNH